MIWWLDPSNTILVFLVFISKYKLYALYLCIWWVSPTHPLSVERIDWLCIHFRFFFSLSLRLSSLRVPVAVYWNGGCRFGTIISTKAILDKNTNKCKGYGFVDFESPSAAEAAVKALQLQGIQAQMAKVIVKVITPFLFIFFSPFFLLLFFNNTNKKIKRIEKLQFFLSFFFAFKCHTLK